MRSTDVTDRTRATVAGLALGDGLAWPSWWHRLAVLAPKRAKRLGQATDFARERGATGAPTPYLQSSPPSLVDAAGPTDDAEWFVVAVRHHLGQRLDGTPASGDAPGVWDELAGARSAEPDAVRGRLGTLMGLDNLAAGLAPPASGNDNAHSFDDIACLRAVAAGLLDVGDPVAAALRAADDAVVTHAQDGVWAASGTAALVAVLVAGGTVPDAVEAALAALPAGSWTANVAAEMLAAAVPGVTTLGLAQQLERTVVDHVYAYATTGPETLGLALAHLTVATGPEQLVLAGLVHPRHADSLAPLCAALAGAAYGTGWLPPDAVEPLPVLRGVAVRGLAGLGLEAVLADVLRHQRRPDAAAATAADDRTTITTDTTRGLGT